MIHYSYTQCNEIPLLTNNSTKLDISCQCYNSIEFIQSLWRICMQYLLIQVASVQLVLLKLLHFKNNFLHKTFLFLKKKWNIQLKVVQNSNKLKFDLSSETFLRWEICLIASVDFWWCLIRTPHIELKMVIHIYQFIYKERLIINISLRQN